MPTHHTLPPPSGSSGGGHPPHAPPPGATQTLTTPRQRPTPIWKTGRFWLLMLVILAIAVGAYLKFFSNGEAFTPFHPEATAAGRLQIAMARTHGAEVKLTDRISLIRGADGTETLVFRNTPADSVAPLSDQGSVLTFEDPTFTQSGEFSLSAYGLEGPIEKLKVETGGKVSIQTWADKPVFRNEPGNGVLVLIFPSALAQSMGAGHEITTTDSNSEADEAEETTPSITVDATELAAIVRLEDGIVAAWKEKLSGDDLRKRVETFEALIAVQSHGNPNFVSDGGNQVGLYGMSQVVVEEAIVGKALTVNLSGDYTGKGESSADAAELLRRMRGDPKLSTQVAMAYWLYLEGQTFPDSPSAAARFKGFSEAWCVIGMVNGSAEMRRRIIADPAEDPTEDPILVAMQPWYESLATYHVSYPIQ